MRLVLRAIRRTAAVAALPIAVALFEVARLPEVSELIDRVPRSTVLCDRYGDPIRYTLTARSELAPWVELRHVHPHLVQATLAAEDRRFHSHVGVDPFSVARALWTNFTHRRIVSGASTISMQVARLLRPLERGYYAKLREALLAVRLELALTKDEILELYVNLSPYGGNARGVEAAARRYLGRSASDLSLSEAALIAGLPQSPARLRPDRHPDAARARRDWVLGRMAALGVVSRHAAREAMRTGIHLTGGPLPFSAPHYAAWALDRVPPGSRVRTALDSILQRVAEEALSAHLERLGPRGVRHVAAVIAETESGKVRALVGSHDFFDPRDGQVNGAVAPRSPGSLLKPFIYLLAFERGVAGPDTVLHDVPRVFRDGYRPENSSGAYAGRVRAGEALARSLNTPAVDLLDRVGTPAALGLFRTLGMGSLRKPAAAHGLSLALGGVEVTLLELVEAYATLGRLGLHRELSFLDDEPPGPARRVAGARAAYEVACALEDAGWSQAAREGGLDLPRLALKTGTSFGLRDAWAVAYTPRYTVGVWAGNFDGTPSPALVGRTAARPLALELARRLEGAGSGPTWFVEPKEGRVPAPVEVGARHGAASSWVSPAHGAVYVLHPLAGGSQLELLSTGAPGMAATYFVGGELAGRAEPGCAVTWPLSRGTHRITRVTQEGDVDVRYVHIED